MMCKVKNEFPKDTFIKSLESIHVILFGKRLSEDVIKLRILRWNHPRLYGRVLRRTREQGRQAPSWHILGMLVLNFSNSIRSSDTVCMLYIFYVFFFLSEKMIEREMVWREKRKSGCWSYFSLFPEYYKFNETGLSKSFSALVLWA